MEHDMACTFCGYFGAMEPTHGKIQCPQCKQMPPMGDCCQGASDKGDTKCLDGDAQSKESQT
jgi:hypothetical protein